MFLYNIGVLLYAFAIHLASPFKKKAKQWVSGRRNWKNNLRNKLEKTKDTKRIWVHCASLGEFEQGLPLIENIKKKHPDYSLILTFFSPSGYEVKKDFPLADVICYLPVDTRSNAMTFVELVKPDLVLFIKYEFWVNFLNILRERSVTTYLVSAVFKNHHPFFKWYGGVFRRSLSAFKVLFVQDQHSKELLSNINISNAQVCGDTRFDRVLDVRKNFKPVTEVERFKSNSSLIVAGSTWPKDEELLLAAFALLHGENIKLLLVPHDIEDWLLKNTVSKIETLGEKCSLYSEGLDPSNRIGILNTMGLLAKVYSYADIAYIGGGLDGGIHNCLEAAVYGIPLAFAGNSFDRYIEAVELIKTGTAKNVNTPEELAAQWKELIRDERRRLTIKQKTDVYFAENSNSTERILTIIGI